MKAVTVSKRGRRSHINRDVVIQTAIELAEKNPGRDVTMAELADALGIVTMGVYRHVRNKDDLLAAMADKTFADLDLQFDLSLPLDQRFYKWTRSFRAFFRERPYAQRLMAWRGHISTPFMEWTADLVTCLTEYGVPKSKMAATVTWLFRELIAYISFEAVVDAASQSAIGAFDLQALSPARRAALKPILPKIMAYTADDLYDLHIEAALARIKQIAGRA